MIKQMASDTTSRKEQDYCSTHRQPGSILIVKQTVDGGPAYTSIAAYNISTGQRSWESAPAIDFRLHADAVILRVDNALRPPFYDYSPVVIEYRDALTGRNGFGQQIFTPGSPAHVDEVQTPIVPLAWIRWPSVLIKVDNEIYRYNLSQPVDAQRPVAAVDGISNVYGVFDNGTVLVAKNGHLLRLSVGNKDLEGLSQPSVSHIKSDVVIDLGRVFIVSYFNGTIVVPEDHVAFYDISADCPEIAAAKLTSKNLLAVLCVDAAHGTRAGVYQLPANEAQARQ